MGERRLYRFITVLILCTFALFFFYIHTYVYVITILEQERYVLLQALAVLCILS